VKLPFHPCLVLPRISGHGGAARPFNPISKWAIACISRASPLIRLMVHPGLLIEEVFLGFRLGVDPPSSAGWANLLSALSGYAYRGVACDCFSSLVGRAGSSNGGKRSSAPIFRWREPTLLDASNC